MAIQQVERQRYRASGRVAWGKFLPLAIITAIAALVLAAVMNWLYSVGWHLVILVPIVFSLLLVIPLSVTIANGKCRSPLLAAALGFAAGLLMYGGYLYFGMVSLLGLQGITRLDLFPSYLSLRLHSDTEHDVGRSSPKVSRPDPYMNGFRMAMELGLVLFFTTSLPYNRARRAFCERCGAWKQQQCINFAPGFAAKIASWLEQGQLSNLASVPLYIPRGKRKSSTMVAIERCNSSTGQSCPVHFAVKEVSTGGGLSAFDGAWGRVTVRRVELARSEVGELAPLFSQLAAPLPMAQASPVLSGGTTATALIEVQPIPTGEAHRVLNKSSNLIANLLVLSILAIFFLSIAGAAGAFYKSGLDDLLQHRKVDAIGLGLWITLALGCVGMVVLSGYIGLKNSGVAGHLYYRFRSRRSIARRKTKWVDPSRPSDLPTFFVQVVPRKNWGVLMLETATDTGFLQIDLRKKEIRFEGDVERYRIPASAITACSLATYSSSAGQSSIEYWVVLLQGLASSGPWEAPISLRQTKWFVPATHRLDSAQMILNQITPLLDGSVGFNGAMPVQAAGDVASAKGFAVNYASLPSEELRPAPNGWLRNNALRIGFTLLAICFGVWRGWSTSNRRTAPPVPSLPPGFTIGGSQTARLSFRISNIRPNQQLSDASPFYSNGGRWTVFDCSLLNDASARFTLAVESPVAAPGGRLISFANAEILPGNRVAGGRVIQAVAEALHQPAPAELSVQPLQPYKIPTAVLGEHLGGPSQGFRRAGGSWVATKWFIQNYGLDAEVYFNYDLSTGFAEMSEKDLDYDSDVLSGLATALRDGPRPLRTPASDPDFTDAGPTVADLQLIPDSLKSFAIFPRAGKLLVLMRQGEVRGVQLDDSRERFALPKLQGAATAALCVDPDGNVFVVGERQTNGPASINANDLQVLWWMDRLAGQKHMITGPWGDHGWIDEDENSISPDQQYLLVHSQSGTVLDQKREQVLYLADLKNHTAVLAETGEYFLSGWTGSGKGLRAKMAKGNIWDAPAKRDEFLIDPSTGHTVGPAVGQAAAAEVVGDVDGVARNRSPDGRRSFVLHAGTDLDVLQIATGQHQKFKFHPDDCRFAQPGSLRWLSGRYLEFNAAKPCFIDVSAMKLGYLPVFSQAKQTLSYQFSPDFHWAIVSDSTGISLGRVLEPSE